MVVAQIKSIQVRSFTEKQGVTFFNVAVESGNRQWTLPKRYSDFVTLQAELAAELNAPLPASLPSKNTWSPRSWLQRDDSLLEERRAGLEVYLRSILNSKDARFRQSRIFTSFLEVPHSMSMSADDYTPASWSEELSEQMSTARSIRAQFSKRDVIMADPSSSVPGSEIRQLSVDAKIRLASLVTATTKLTNGLSELGKKGLVQAELRRLTDGLTKLQDEVELLGKMAVASRRLPPTASVSSTSAPAKEASPSARNDLLGSAAARPARVLGKKAGPAAETDVTRPLDHEGLMQLQQTQMDEQDERLDAITAVLRRQRLIAGNIHEELVEQNELLGQLETEVDQTSSKLGKAQKTIKKLG